MSDLEGAAVDTHVLAEHEHSRVAAHLLPEPVADRLKVRLFGHLLVVGSLELLGGCEDAVEQGARVGLG